MSKRTRHISVFLFSGLLLAGGLIFWSSFGSLFQAHAQASPVLAQVLPTPGPTTADPTQTFPRTITVNGSGSAQITPDIAIIDLGVTTEAKTAREALSVNNQHMQSLITTLKGQGIAVADIRTQSVQIYPRYDNPPVQPSNSTTEQVDHLIGYTASNTVEVTIRKLDILGQVLDQAVSAGSNTMQGIRFDVSNPAQAMDQAREAAMRDAIHKAQQLAGLANAKVGVVVTISESSNRPIPYMAQAGAARSAADAVPVSPGTQTITVDLQVTWELQ